MLVCAGVARRHFAQSVQLCANGLRQPRAAAMIQMVGGNVLNSCNKSEDVVHEEAASYEYFVGVSDPTQEPSRPRRSVELQLANHLRVGDFNLYKRTLTDSDWLEWIVDGTMLASGWPAQWRQCAPTCPSSIGLLRPLKMPISAGPASKTSLCYLSRH